MIEDLLLGVVPLLEEIWWLREAKKQQVVAGSSVEADFKSMTQGIYELMWLRSLMHQLKIENGGSMRLYCDNKAAISIAHNPV